MRDARKLAQTRSKLGPKIRAEVRTRSSLGFQYSYSLGAQDFDARPIPMLNTFYIVVVERSSLNFLNRKFTTTQVLKWGEKRTQKSPLQFLKVLL